MDKSSKSWVRSEIQALTAYHVADPVGLIKLDNMENPYTWDASVEDAWLQKLKAAEINRYPDPASKQLDKALRKAFSIPEKYSVLLGNGSDELIQMICMALAKPGATVLSPAPTFVMYKMIAMFCNMNYQAVELNADFSLPTQAMLGAIAKHQPAVIYISYPNNPTGNLFNEESICQLIEAAPGLVVLDEAYFSFANASFLPYLDKYTNLIVMRTVSKMGMAGLRLGYMVGHKEWIDEFNKVRLPFNINCLTQVTAEFALEHKAEFELQTQKICDARAKLFEEMASIDDIQCFDSAANFILFRTKAGEADRIYDSLKDAGILIRNLSAHGGLLADCLRVTVGKTEENKAFINALREIV